MAGISTNIFSIISTHKKIQPKFANKQSIRQTISNIKKDNPGLTSNGATQIFAQKYGVSVFRYLDDEDKNSMSYFKPKTQFALATGQTQKRGPRTRKRALVLPFDQKLVNEAEKNMEIYPYVYILENSLRKLILDKFAKISNWWLNNKIVKQDIQDYAKRIQKAEMQHKWVGPRGKHPIYYIGLEHLYKIIEMNYNPYFKGLFDISNLKTWINECVPIRNLVAHNIPTQKTERDNIKIRTQYICNSIK